MVRIAEIPASILLSARCVAGIRKAVRVVWCRKRGKLSGHVRAGERTRSDKDALVE